MTQTHENPSPEAIARQAAPDPEKTPAPHGVVPAKKAAQLNTLSDRDKLIAWAASQIMLPSSVEADIPLQLRGLLQELSKDDPGFTLKFAVSLKIPLELVWPRFALWLCDDFLQPFFSSESKVAVVVVVRLYQEWLDGKKPERSRWRKAADAVWATRRAATATAAYATAAYAAAAAYATAAYAADAAYATAATAAAYAAAAATAAATAIRLKARNKLRHFLLTLSDTHDE